MLNDDEQVIIVNTHNYCAEWKIKMSVIYLFDKDIIK